MRKRLILSVLVICTCLLNISPNTDDETLNQMLSAGKEFYNNSDYIKAVDTLQSAYSYYESLELNKKEKLLSIYIYIGISAIHIGDHSLSLENLNKAESIAIDLGKSEDYLHRYIYYNVALVYNEIGEFKKSILLLEEVLKQIDDQILTQYVFHELGITYYEKGDYKKAIGYFEKIINIRENQIDNMDYTLNQCAKAYGKLDQNEKALELLYRSLKIGKKKYDEKPYEVAIIYKIMGEILGENLNDPRGLHYLKKALSIYYQSLDKYHYLTINCYASIGDYFFAKDQPDSALFYYQKSLMPSSGDYFQNPDLENRLVDQYYLDLLLNKSLALRKKAKQSNPKKHLLAADQTLQLAIKAIHILKRSYQFEESRLNLGKKEREILENNFQVAIELLDLTGEDQYKEQAFILSDQMKYITLHAKLNEQQAMENAIPAHIRQEEENIAKQIAAFRKTIMNQQNNADVDSQLLNYAQNQLFELYLRQDSLIKVYENQYPHYYRLKFQDRTIKIKELQNRISRKQSVVSYTVSDSMLYTFVVNKRDFELASTRVNQSFYDAISDYQTTISRSFLDNEVFISSALTLHEYLINPIASYIRENLVIVPDNAIGYISFESLLSKPVESDNVKKWPYLIHDHIFSYSFTCFQLTQPYHDNKKTSSQLLAIAPGYPEKSQYLSIQEFTHQEVKNIASYFDTKKLLGKQATLDNFIKHKDGFDMLHIAAHGLLDTTRDFSGLVFYPALDDSSVLYNYEISAMNLFHKMVVLSACNTGKGDMVKGEGIMSLGRSFVSSGSKAVVLSLWQSFGDVDKEIYKSFYKYLARGYDKATALNKAKRKYIKNAELINASPQKWSGHILIGSTLPVTHKQPWGIYLGLMVVIGMIIWLFIKRNNKINESA